MLSFAERAIFSPFLGGGKQLFVYSLMMREAHRSIRRLETAAKRRKGAGNDVPCWGDRKSTRLNSSHSV